MNNRFWTRNSDESYACTRCGAPSFAPGGSDEDLPTTCNCPAGVLAAQQDPRKSEQADAAQPATGAPAGTTSVVETLPTVNDYERQLNSTLRAIRRWRKRCADAPVEDEYTKTDNGKGVWREAWRGVHSKLKLEGDAYEAERKTLVTLREMGKDREQPEQVEREERLARYLAAVREGRLEEAHSIMVVEGSAN